MSNFCQQVGAQHKKSPRFKRWFASVGFSLLVNRTAHNPWEINFLSSGLLFFGLTDSAKRDNCCLPQTHPRCKDSPGKAQIMCRETVKKSIQLRKLDTQLSDRKWLQLTQYWITRKMMGSKNWMWHTRLILKYLLVACFLFFFKHIYCQIKF